MAVPLLAERRGLIVNITSDAASAAYPGWGPYGASKAALELLTRTLADELRDQAVSAVLVDPGDMRTRMHQDAFPAEDISDRPLPEVTLPFWNWLFDQDPETVRGRALRGPTGGRAMAAAGVVADFTLPVTSKRRAAGGARAPSATPSVCSCPHRRRLDRTRPLCRSAAMADARRSARRQHERDVERGAHCHRR